MPSNAADILPVSGFHGNRARKLTGHFSFHREESIFAIPLFALGNTHIWEFVLSNRPYSLRYNTNSKWELYIQLKKARKRITCFWYD